LQVELENVLKKEICSRLGSEVLAFKLISYSWLWFKQFVLLGCGINYINYVSIIILTVFYSISQCAMIVGLLMAVPVEEF